MCALFDWIQILQTLYTTKQRNSVLNLNTYKNTKNNTQKAGKQQDEFEDAQIANESDSGRNWINGTYVKRLKRYELHWNLISKTFYNIKLYLFSKKLIFQVWI